MIATVTNKVKSGTNNAANYVGEIDIKADDVKSVTKSAVKNTGKAGAIGAGTIITAGLTTGGLAAAGIAGAPILGGAAGLATAAYGVKKLWGRKKESGEPEDKVSEKASEVGAVTAGMAVGGAAFGPIGLVAGGAAAMGLQKALKDENLDEDDKALDE